MRLRLPRSPDWLLPAIGLLILVGTLCLPFGLKRPDRMEGWVLMNDLEQQDSPISQNLDGTGRPLLLLTWFIAHSLDAGSFLGAHVLLMVMLFGKGFTLYAILRRLFPGRGLFAFLVAVLFVAYPGDTGTVDTRILNIHSAVLFYLIAVYFLAAFWQSTSRLAAAGLGIAAVTSLTISLATYEIAYPLVIFTPLILRWLGKRSIRRLALTTGLWYLGPLLYGLYWLHTSMGALPEYQNQLLRGGLETGAALPQMLVGLLGAYAQGFWGGWVDAFMLIQSAYLWLAVLTTFLIMLIARRCPDSALSRTQSLGLLGAGSLIFLLGFLPYLPTSLRTDTWRVFLYASIGAALGIAALTRMVVSLFPARNVVWLGLVFPLIASGMLSDFNQEQIFGENSSAQEWILEALVKQAPRIHPGTLILLLDDPADMDADRIFWANIYFDNAVRYLYADQTLHARICYPNLGTWGDWNDRCQLGDQQVIVEGGGFKPEVVTTYDKVLAFRYSSSAGATLLWKIPEIDRPGQGSDAYNPRQVVDFSGAPPPRAYTLFDSWSIPAPQPAFTPIVDGETIGLGSSWYPPESDGRRTFQWVNNDAEFIVSAGQEPVVTLRLEVEPGPGLEYQPFQLCVFNAAKELVAAVGVQTEQSVELILPLDPDRATLFRLHVNGGGKTIPTDPRIMNFRVFRMSLPSATATD